MSREKFLKVYSDLPYKIREEPIVVIDGKPISWNVAYIEIKNNTKLGETILEKLKNMGLM